jgi:hypothetical protein
MAQMKSEAKEEPAPEGEEAKPEGEKHAEAAKEKAGEKKE